MAQADFVEIAGNLNKIAHLAKNNPLSSHPDPEYASLYADYREQVKTFTGSALETLATPTVRDFIFEHLEKDEYTYLYFNDGRHKPLIREMVYQKVGSVADNFRVGITTQLQTESKAPSWVNLLAQTQQFLPDFVLVDPKEKTLKGTDDWFVDYSEPNIVTSLGRTDLIDISVSGNRLLKPDHFVSDPLVLTGFSEMVSRLLYPLPKWESGTYLPFANVYSETDFRAKLSKLQMANKVLRGESV